MAAYDIDEHGRVLLDSEGVFQLWFQGGVTDGTLVRPDEALAVFNEQCRLHDKTEHAIIADDSVPEPHTVRAKRWLIPKSFQTLDVEDYCLSLCATDIERERVRREMSLFRSHDMIAVLQTLIYMVDVFRQNKIVWGIGRGSSVASYVLYLIGVHKIDSIRFDLDIEDFLR